ncbi:type II secretion system protein GspL [Sphingopyxis yananensis]|uniref:type II secretion system protein GspL n=1 Tax=Sphingopyxis yananensis TaxID=2886687 RepID=UPI001D12C1EF|nr:type II secretion system protein GspL [Sphingopyxis yananensis]MCC2601991.1 type II secretion system protein GspL [Sphingopyxis yananensis]
MTDILILGLPNVADLAAQAPDWPRLDAPYWAHIADGQMVSSGAGNGWRSVRDQLLGQSRDLSYALLAPAWDAPVRYRAFPNASPAQASTAGRLDVQQQILGATDQQHVVAGLPSRAGESFAVAVTTHSAMALWLAWLAEQGIASEDMRAIMPAAALWPEPAEGVLLGAALGDEQIMRSRSLGYAADPVIDELLRAGDGAADVIWMTDAERDVCAANAAMQPMLDLRSGRWAVKQRRSWDGAMLWWIKRLALALVVLTIAIFTVQMLRLASERARAEQAVMDKAQSLNIEAADAASAEAEMDRRLMQRGGGPLAFSVPASALYAALGDAPAVSLKTLSHRADGTLSATLGAPRVEDLNPVLLALQAKAYRITAQPMAGSDGQQMANITIRAVP